MAANHRDPLPVEAVRDLLGITRALYRAERDGAGDPVRLQELKEIGEALRKALNLATAGADTVGGRAAWGWAEKATARLGALVTDETKLAPVVTAATERIRGR